MLYRAVDTDHSLPSHGEVSPLDRSCGPRLARAVSRNGTDLRSCEEAYVEVHRLFGDSFEHEERGDRVCHENLPAPMLTGASIVMIFPRLKKIESKRIAVNEVAGARL